MADRAAQIARIEQIERIQKLEGSSSVDASGNGVGAPGPQAMGTPDSPGSNEPDDWVTNLQNTVSKVGTFGHMHNSMLAPLEVGRALANSPVGQTIESGVGKAVNYLGGLARTAGAYGIGAVKPGLNPIGMEEGLKALLANADRSGELAQKLGVKTIDLFNIPGTDRKVTSKDLINLIGDTATNPLVYPKFTNWVGRGMYNSAINPVEVEGERLDKGSVGDILNKHRVKTVGQMAEKAQPIVDANELKARALESKATAQGAETDIGAATEHAQRQVDAIKKFAKPGSSEEAMAQAMQKEIDLHKQMAPKEVFTPKPENVGYEAPTEKTAVTAPGYEASGTQSKTLLPQPNTQLMDEVPKKLTQRLKAHVSSIEDVPVINDAVDRPNPLPVQGETAQIPGPSPEATSQWKTDAYNKASQSAYDPAKRMTAWQGFYKSLGYGLKDSTEKAIEKTLGPEAAAEYRRVNAETGALLSTGKAQKRVVSQHGRDMDIITSPLPSKTEGIASAITGGEGGMEAGLKTAAIMRAVRAMGAAKMPIGYAIRNADPAMLKAAVVGNQINPWTKPQGE